MIDWNQNAIPVARIEVPEISALKRAEGLSPDYVFLSRFGTIPLPALIRSHRSNIAGAEFSSAAFCPATH